MCSPFLWQTLFCQSLLESLVAVVVSMVPHSAATDRSAPHKPFSVFLNSLSFLPLQEHSEVISILLAVV